MRRTTSLPRAAQSDQASAAGLSQHRRDAELEAWIVKTLRVRDLFAGTTTREIRRDRLVALLTQRGILDSHAGRLGGKACSWRDLVTKLYGDQAGSMSTHND